MKYKNLPGAPSKGAVCYFEDRTKRTASACETLGYGRPVSHRPQSVIRIDELSEISIGLADQGGVRNLSSFNHSNKSNIRPNQLARGTPFMNAHLQNRVEKNLSGGPTFPVPLQRSAWPADQSGDVSCDIGRPRRTLQRQGRLQPIRPQRPRELRCCFCSQKGWESEGWKGGQVQGIRGSLRGKENVLEVILKIHLDAFRLSSGILDSYPEGIAQTRSFRKPEDGRSRRRFGKQPQ